MDGHEHIAKAHPSGDRILVHLDVFVARQADEVRDGLADIGDRQRHAGAALDEAQDQRIGDRLTLLLNVDGNDGRYGRGLRPG